MSGITDLDELLNDLRPRLSDERYVFAAADWQIALPETFAVVREAEGVTVVVEVERAKQLGLAFDFVAAKITLEVPSALEAVGLTAVVASALADADISCNVIAGLRHDHLFVPAERAEDALAILSGLAERLD